MNLVLNQFQTDQGFSLTAPDENGVVSLRFLGEPTFRCFTDRAENQYVLDATISAFESGYRRGALAQKQDPTTHARASDRIDRALDLAEARREVA